MTDPLSHVNPVRRGRRHAVLRAVGRCVLHGVASDDVLLPLYPEAPDLRGARHRLTLFLAQYWGGPTTYNDERGHPKSADAAHAVHRRSRRARPLAAPHGCCRRAVCPDRRDRRSLMAYFVPAAEQMRNDTGLPISSPRSTAAGRSRRSQWPPRAFSESMPSAIGMRARSEHADNASGRQSPPVRTRRRHTSSG